MFFLLKLLVPFIVSTNQENSLKNSLLENYYPDALPVNNNSIEMKIGIAIKSLTDINQIEGTIQSNIWLRLWWEDTNLKWDKDKWNISKLSFYTNPELDRSIWIPDIYLYNTAEKPLENLDYTSAMVYNDGSVIWSRPGVMTSTCVFDLTYFPYDQQVCEFKFGSWVYHSGQLNVSVHKTSLDLSNYQINQEWKIISHVSYIEEKKYNCCPEKFQSAVFILTLRRKPGYYILNIILPTFATATLMIISLLVPWDSGERISFSVTVMLSIIVFLLILSESLPKTNTKPLLSKMLIGLVFFSLFVVFFTVIIGMMHSHTKKNSKTAKLILDFLNKFNIRCNKKKKVINRNNSYLESINEVNNTITTHNEDEKDCDKLASKIEKLFTIIFFIGFVIYSSVVFSEIPTY